MATKQTILPTTAGQACRAKLAEARDELDAVEIRLAEIVKEEEDLFRKKARLDIVIETLEPLCDQERESAWVEIETLGIQECCYRVLLESESPLSAQEIRFELKELGIDMDRYANPPAVIHTSLKRIPERVRSFKKYCRDPVTDKRATSRFYEAIREKKKTAGTAKQPGEE